MGGWGSGRHGWKSTTDDFRSLDVRALSRGGWLSPGAEFTSKWSRRGEVISSVGGRSESDRVVLTYRHQRNGEPWESLEYAIRIDRTRCHYGGSRPWFVCPGLGCGRRAAILYSGKYFLCRHCRELAYKSQRESDIDRALARAQELHMRIGGNGCVIDGEPFRRKGMHRKTYSRLMHRYRWFDSRLRAEEVRRFGSLALH